MVNNNLIMARQLNPDEAAYPQHPDFTDCGHTLLSDIATKIFAARVADIPGDTLCDYDGDVDVGKVTLKFEVEFAVAAARALIDELNK